MPTVVDVLVYVDSSVLGRAYLPDELGHDEAAALIEGGEHLLVTSSWTRVEVTSALARAGRARRIGDLEGLLNVLAGDLGESGPVTVLRPETARVEDRASEIVRSHALRSLDALHLAVAELAAVPLLDPGHRLGFATRDNAQREAAEAFGFAAL